MEQASRLRTRTADTGHPAVADLRHALDGLPAVRRAIKPRSLTRLKSFWPRPGAIWTAPTPSSSPTSVATRG